MKKKKAFSLVEILVVLVIISVIASAFAPAITKKLKANSITINDIEDKRTRPPQSQEDCTPFNAMFIPTKSATEGICVTKFNVGDSGGPPIYQNVKKIISFQDSCSDSGNCCFVGRTAGRCSDKDSYGGTYSGCNRTVCQKNAGKKSCENWTPFVNGYTISGWRLPNNSELNYWNNNLDEVTTTLGSKGLQLCSKPLTGTKAEQGSDMLNYDEIYCIQTGKSCKGATSGNCFPYDVWGSDSAFYFITTEQGVKSLGSNYAASVRCVLDKLPYQFIGGTSSNFSTQQTRDLIQFIGEPQKQADCEPFNAVFIPAKFNGTFGLNICVTKYNLEQADSTLSPQIYSYDYLDSSFVIPVGSGVAKKGMSNYTCWKGGTANEFADNWSKDGSIPWDINTGRYRTVCGFTIYRQSPQKWRPQGSKWRVLPLSVVKGWKENLPSSSELQNIIYDLNFCTSSADVDGFMQCRNNGSNQQTDGKCKYYDDEGNVKRKWCRPWRNWVDNGTENGNYFSFTSKTEININTSTIDNTQAYSGRYISWQVPVR